eukprot:TRINITY_DN11912_c0_g2_i2.p1 TRINITY_DN11912_c0_g2~~TRINITY_DN11912_c0_g2_i2.p1  ORF type:complete len:1185 (+),score=287.73 TRINITY_DN11912_c0_g2_i2:64-3618(+)
MAGDVRSSALPPALLLLQGGQLPADFGPLLSPCSNADLQSPGTSVADGADSPTLSRHGSLRSPGRSSFRMRKPLPALQSAVPPAEGEAALSADLSPPSAPVRPQTRVSMRRSPRPRGGLPPRRPSRVGAAAAPRAAPLSPARRSRCEMQHDPGQWLVPPGSRRSRRKLPVAFRADSASPLLPCLALSPLYMPWAIGAGAQPIDQKRALLRGSPQRLREIREYRSGRSTEAASRADRSLPASRQRTPAQSRPATRQHQQQEVQAGAQVPTLWRPASPPAGPVGPRSPHARPAADQPLVWRSPPIVAVVSGAPTSPVGSAAATSATDWHAQWEEVPPPDAEEAELLRVLEGTRALRRRLDTPRQVSPKRKTSPGARLWMQQHAEAERAAHASRRQEREEQRRCWALERQLEEENRAAELRLRRERRRERREQARERFELLQSQSLSASSMDAGGASYLQDAAARRRVSQWRCIIPAARAMDILAQKWSEIKAWTLMRRLLVPLMRRRVLRRLADRARRVATASAMGSTDRLTVEDLRPLRPFRHWPVEALHQLCTKADLRVFEEGKYVCYEDDPCGWFGVVVSGEVIASCRITEWVPAPEDPSIAKSRQKEHGTVIWTRGYGCCLPLMGLLGPAFWPFSVNCETEVALWAITPHLLKQVIATLPEECQADFQALQALHSERQLEAPVLIGADSLKGAFSCFAQTDWHWEELEDFLEYAKPAVFYDGQRIFEEGELGDGLWVVRHGAVALVARRYAPELEMKDAQKPGSAAGPRGAAPSKAPGPDRLAAGAAQPIWDIVRPSPAVERAGMQFTPRRTSGTPTPQRRTSGPASGRAPSPAGTRVPHDLVFDSEEEMFITTLGPGDGFGECSVLWAEPRTFSAVACGTVLLAHIPRDPAMEFVHGSPERLFAMQGVVNLERDEKLWRPPRNILRSSGILNHLPDKELAALLRACRPLVLAPGDLLVEAGEPVHWVFYFLCGGVEPFVEGAPISPLSPDGRSPDRDDSGGTFLGLKEAFVDSPKWPQSLKSVSKCDIWCLPAAYVLNMLWAHLGEQSFAAMRKAVHAELGVPCHPPPSGGSAPWMTAHIPGSLPRQTIEARRQPPPASAPARKSISMKRRSRANSQRRHVAIQRSMEVVRSMRAQQQRRKISQQRGVEARGAVRSPGLRALQGAAGVRRMLSIRARKRPA